MEIIKPSNSNEVWERTNLLLSEDDCFYIENQGGSVGKNRVLATKIEHGLKILVRESAYLNLINNKELNEDFMLNCKRKNRWYWSVYFFDKRIAKDIVNEMIDFSGLAEPSENKYYDVKGE